MGGETFEELLLKIQTLDVKEQIEAINKLKLKIHKISPFKNEPVDCVLWVNNENIKSNDYNPNNVAPPEMKLLEHSIESDGYTQPIVSWKHDDFSEVVDGFHRFRVGKESTVVKNRIMGYLPIVTINKERQNRGDRIASTIRHNRARGKHGVDSMSEIVVELKKRNWSPKKIGKELGMDKDEVLRLCQISGLREIFSNTDFTEAWEAENLKDEEFGDIKE